MSLPAPTTWQSARVTTPVATPGTSPPTAQAPTRFQPVAPRPWPLGRFSSSRLWRTWSEARDDALLLGRAGLSVQAWRLRSGLRVSDLASAEGARALGLVAAAAQLVLGFRVHDEQALAAWWMLQGRLAEMATGEGKTLATGLAAATAALAGLRVHVMTANDYLVSRDREQLLPLFQLLGLSSAAVVHTLSREERAPAYRADIVYVTARELVFDHLKDHLAQHAERDPRVLRARALGEDGGASGGQPLSAQPLVPGLQQAFVDEADSILLDEASVPFILSAPGAPPAALPLQLARRCALQLPPQAYRLQPRQRSARLTDEGRRQAQALLEGLARPGGPLWPMRLALELVRAALVAEHLLQRGRDYALKDDALVLIDEVTGRVAEGRQWNHPLQAMVELKEGLPPSAPMLTAARITYQRLFPRYERLGGSSGTLREARAELRALYGLGCSTVPRVRPSQLEFWGRRLFRDVLARERACVARIQALRGLGRPVLVGTDSVQASESLCALLARQGIPHTVLNAVQDAEEHRVVAQAGEPGRVTVTTNMAGRGTDIALSPAARQAGGLHVILALSNRSRRIDRQLAGRAARQGDPGSAEALLSLDDAPLRLWLPACVRAMLKATANREGELPRRSADAVCAWVQRRSEWRDWQHRRDLGLQEDQTADALAFSGVQE
jgi:preprotein translocase subunit SecA